MPDAKHIVIIGGGFCGTLTAVHLIKNSKIPLKITLVNAGSPFARGIAYSAYSLKHLLNVPAGSMSAFPGDTGHFVDWLLKKNTYSAYSRDLLEKTFIPRVIYGDYLYNIWNAALAEKKDHVELSVIEDFATAITLNENNTVTIYLKKGVSLSADYAVLATGNDLPRNPSIENSTYYSSNTYYQNPWNSNATNNLTAEGDILIIGNGLTMADTVIQLVEQGFKNKIYSLSTNGFGMLPHRHPGVSYTGLVEEIKNDFTLYRLFHLINKHIKKVRKLGISAEPVIDSLRPYSGQIWQSFTTDEKKLFLTRFRYRWGVARHRLPVLVYDILENLRISGQLQVYRGRLCDIIEKGNLVHVTFYNSKKQQKEILAVQRVINCTGPETSIYKTGNPLLYHLAEKNIISTDPFELGINTNPLTYRVMSAAQKEVPTLFTLGTNLKGMVWETVAIPELKVQCKELAEILLQACAT